MRATLFVAAFMFVSCAPANQPASADTLAPYASATHASSPTAEVLIANTPLPTPTPITYVIQSGDTLSQLAETYHISQDALRAANPDVNPNALAIGSTIVIPSASSAAAANATPTPVALALTQTICHASADRGQWCFALLQNGTGSAVENASVQITLLDANGATLASLTAFTPQDLIPVGASMPAFAFFANASAHAHAQVQLLSALLVTDGEARYLPASLANTQTQTNAAGHYAQLSGQVFLAANSRAATRVWVSAIAYDADHRVVGVRRWDGGAIRPGASLDFHFGLASLGGVIEAVEFFVQAQ